MTAEYDIVFSKGKEKWQTRRSIKEFNKMQSTLKSTLKSMKLSTFPVEKSVKKKGADKIFFNKRGVLEKWLLELCTAELHEKNPEFADFIGQKKESSQMASPPRAGSKSAAQAASSPGASLIQEKDEEIEKLKKHNRRATMELEDAMQMFAELEIKSKQLEEDNAKSLEQMKKQQGEHAEYTSLFKSNKEKQQESSKRVYELESMSNKLASENKQLFKVNADLRGEVESKQETIQRLESKIETLQISTRKVEREKTDLEISRIELQRKLEHQRLLKMDEDNVERVVDELEKENALLRETQMLNQLFVDEEDPIIVAMTEKIKELENAVEKLLIDKKRTVDELLAGKKEELLRVTTELTNDLDGAAQTEILVLRKELLIKESELKDKEIELVEQKKEIEGNVFKKFKEKLTHIRSESSRRFDKLRVEVAKLTSTTHHNDGGANKEDMTDREILRLRRLLLDQENSERKMKMELESQEKQYEVEIFHMTNENESLKNLALSKNDSDSAMMAMMKQQISDLNDEIKAKARTLEEERKLREKDKIAADTNYKTLQIDFEDLQKASTKKVERLKLDLQKKENDLLHVHADGLHGVEDMEELHRKCRALTAELSELKKERILNRGASYLNSSIQRLQSENDQLRTRVLDLRNSKIKLITSLSIEMDNMRSELKYYMNGRRGDPPRYQRRQQNESGHEKRNTIDKTLGVADDQKYEAVYDNFTWEQLRPQQQIETAANMSVTVDDL